MKKVLHLRSSGAFLGAEKVVLELARHSGALGYEPVIGMPVDDDIEPELAVQARQHGIRCELFGFSSPFSYSSAKLIGEFARAERVDIVHSHGYREDVYAWLACDRRRILATNHLWKRTSLRLRGYAAADALVMRGFPALVAVSQPIFTEMSSMGFTAEKLHIIENGICSGDYFPDKPQRNEVRDLFAIGADDFVFGMLGSLTIEKGHELALAAMAELTEGNPRLKLLIVGDGPEEERLKNIVRSDRLRGHVVFAGRRSDIPKVLQAFDVLVMPSLNEGLPMALLEALASGVPAIASNVGDIPKVLTPQVGSVVSAGDLGQLVHEMKRFSETDELKRMSANARQLVDEKFSARRMTERYVALYERIIAKSPC